MTAQPEPLMLAGLQAIEVARAAAGLPGWPSLLRVVWGANATALGWDPVSLRAAEADIEANWPVGCYAYPVPRKRVEGELAESMATTSASTSGAQLLEAWRERLRAAHAGPRASRRTPCEDRPSARSERSGRPGLAALPISLAAAAGARRMLVEHGSGASIAAALAARTRAGGLDQLVLTIDAGDASAGMQACLDGLILAGHGRDRSVLCRNVATTWPFLTESEQSEWCDIAARRTNPERPAAPSKGGEGA